MTLRPADRRRLVFASVLTAVVFPAVWWENNRESAVTRPNVAAVGLAADDAAPPSSAVPATPAAPAYLSAKAPAVSVPTATLLVGSTADLIASTQASFDGRIDRPDVCWFGGVNDGEIITVVNRANGQSLDCRVVGSVADEPRLVVLGPSAFVALADYTDAPIHVDVTR